MDFSHTNQTTYVIQTGIQLGGLSKPTLYKHQESLIFILYNKIMEQNYTIVRYIKCSGNLDTFKFGNLLQSTTLRQEIAFKLVPV